MTNVGRRDIGSIKELIELGSEMAGSVAGASFGLLLGGPGGAVTGSAAGPIVVRSLQKVGKEIVSRWLGHQEAVRIGATLIYAAAKIQENLKAGHAIRQDDFFAAKPGSRPTSEEIAEGVVLVAQREHEEKKLPFYGNLLANVAFHLGIDRTYANLLVRLGKELSYRQLCLLALFAQKKQLGLREGDYRDVQSFPPTQLAILYEIFDLDRRALVSSGSASFGPSDVKPGKLRVQGAGAVLFTLMELWSVDPQDVRDVAIHLR